MAVDEGCSTLWVLESTAAEVGRLTRVLRAGKSTAFQAPSEQTSARFAYLGGGRREGGNGAHVRTEPLFTDSQAKITY